MDRCIPEHTIADGEFLLWKRQRFQMKEQKERERKKYTEFPSEVLFYHTKSLESSS